jgi:hypothetical protein
MKVKEVLNRFFHVYVINVTLTSCVIIFWAYFTMLSPNSKVMMLTTSPKFELDYYYHQQLAQRHPPNSQMPITLPQKPIV